MTNFKQIRIDNRVDVKLDALSKARKDVGSLIKTKQAIVADLIEQAYKKEIECK